MTGDEKRKLIAKLYFIKCIRDSAEEENGLEEFENEWIKSERMVKVWNGLFNELGVDILDGIKVVK